MNEEKNIFVFVPAYNVSRTIGEVIDGIKKELRECFILVVDDGSIDGTSDIVKERGVYVISHSKNMGYGAVQKAAFDFFRKNNFSIAVMIHGDGQHEPKFLKELIKKIENGADLCLGSRMMRKLDALKGGMPLLKFFVNIFLTYMENKVLGANLSEFHSGFRSFSKKLISSLFDSGIINIMSDSFIFDQQILFFAIYQKFKISEIPVSTRYDSFSSQVKLKDGIIYSYHIVKMASKYILFKRGIIKDFKDVIRV